MPQVQGAHLVQIYAGGDSERAALAFVGDIILGRIDHIRLYICAVLLGVSFYIVKHPSEVLGGVTQIGGGCIIQEHFCDSIFDFNFYLGASFHELVG